LLTLNPNLNINLDNLFMIIRKLFLALIAITFSSIIYSQLPADFPAFTVNKTGETAPGNVFLSVSSTAAGTGYYVFTLNDEGEVQAYKELDGDYAYDFKMQPNGLLSYAQFLSHHSYSGGGECDP